MLTRIEVSEAPFHQAAEYQALAGLALRIVGLLRVEVL